MSINMRRRAASYTVKPGSRATLSIIILDSDGFARDMTDTLLYDTCKWKVWKPDGTLIIDSAAVYANRPTGEITYTLQAGDILEVDGGIWEGEVEIFDSSSFLVDQSHTFDFIIEKSH